MIRLLHSVTLDFEEFEDQIAPPYAILSHTWLDAKDEMKYQDMVDGVGRDRPGYAKIKRCAQVAAKRGIQYIWADTASIDKRSSAELSEAINSMFNWYKEAKVCFVYLADVSVSAFAPPYEEFRNSRWFSRGWTLQELLAPADITFFSKEWIPLGSKTEHIDLICEVTHIHAGALTGEPVSHYSVAQRMSWAARRQTTRVEDTAYCLMGIFDVNMALLYGERHKAFLRLQEEIMKISNDQSIFAWSDPFSHPDQPVGLLAYDPALFADSANIRYRQIPYAGKAFSLTNRGIHIWLQFQEHIWQRKAVYNVLLDCDMVIGNEARTRPVVTLRPMYSDVTSHVDFLFVRVYSNELPTVDAAVSTPDSGFEHVYALHYTPVSSLQLANNQRRRALGP